MLPERCKCRSNSYSRVPYGKCCNGYDWFLANINTPPRSNRRRLAPSALATLLSLDLTNVSRLRRNVFCRGYVNLGRPAPQSLSRREEESLKRVLLDVYRNLTLLQNFAIVNYTAVVKVRPLSLRALRSILGSRFVELTGA